MCNLTMPKILHLLRARSHTGVEFCCLKPTQKAMTQNRNCWPGTTACSGQERPDRQPKLLYPVTAKLGGGRHRPEWMKQKSRGFKLKIDFDRSSLQTMFERQHSALSGYESTYEDLLTLDR